MGSSVLEFDPSVSQKVNFWLSNTLEDSPDFSTNQKPPENSNLIPDYLTSNNSTEWLLPKGAGALPTARNEESGSGPMSPLSNATYSIPDVPAAITATAAKGTQATSGTAGRHLGHTASSSQTDVYLPTVVKRRSASESGKDLLDSKPVTFSTEKLLHSVDELKQTYLSSGPDTAYASKNSCYSYTKSCFQCFIFL